MFIHVQDNHLKHKLTQGKRVAEQITAGQRPLEKDVNALIMGYKAVGKISQAEGLMKMLVEHSDLKLTPFMFNELISHYSRLRGPRKANFWMTRWWRSVAVQTCTQYADSSKQSRL